MAGSSDKATALERKHFGDIRAAYTASHFDAILKYTVRANR
jgi:hypothetical protein